MLAGLKIQLPVKAVPGLATAYFATNAASNDEIPPAPLTSATVCWAAVRLMLPVAYWETIAASNELIEAFCPPDFEGVIV